VANRDVVGVAYARIVRGSPMDAEVSRFVRYEYSESCIYF